MTFSTRISIRSAGGVLGGVLLTLLLAACDEKTPDALAPMPRIPVPSDVTAVQLGAGDLTVNWAFDQTFPFSGFAVYRSDDGGASYEKVATVSAPPYIDSAVQVELLYWYRIAGVDQSGVEGPLSAGVAATAALYEVLVEGGEVVVNQREVTLTFTAPPGTKYVRYGPDSLFTGQPWRGFVGAAPYTLSPGDGEKTIYAQFIDPAGNITAVISGTVRLDTYAGIASQSFACLQACVSADTVSPGTTLHFTVTAEDNELDGFTEVFIEGRGADPVISRDDGTNGDAVARDGVYEADVTFPLAFRQHRMRMSAIFTDAAGNESPDVEFATTLTMSDPPEAVFLFPPVDSTASSISLRWTRSEEEYFSRYEIYRGTTLPIDPSVSFLAASITQRTTTTFTDSTLAAGTQYRYQIFVVNDMGELTGSGVRTGNTLVPPSGSPRGRKP